MIDIQVCLQKLVHKDDTEKESCWFSLPIDIDELNEKLNIENEDEEIAVIDSESPIKIDEITTIEYLNDIYYLLEEIKEEMILNSVEEIIDYWFSNLNELVNSQGYLNCYHGCYSMRDVAISLIEDLGLFNGVSDTVKRHFNYDEYADELERDGDFLIVDGGVIEYYG